LEITIRPILPTDVSFLWEMLYQAIYIPPGESNPQRDILQRPELARYVRNWGRVGDLGFLAIDLASQKPIGAAWIRLFTAEARGYGYVNDQTPELTVAVLPEYRWVGVGTRLIHELLARVSADYPAVSLSVDPGSPALRFYKHLGFKQVGKSGTSVTMMKEFSATLYALTHLPSPELEACQLTYLDRQPINYRRARLQHRDYCEALRDCGAEVRTLSVNTSLPDSAFIEDCAVILDELAVITSMGTQARREELPGIEPEVARLRPIKRISPPATLEGGDVLQVGKRFFVGLSPRTNKQGIQAFSAIVEPLGYQVIPVTVHGCLHLKTGCTALDGETVLINPEWVDPEPFQDLRRLPVPRSEPWGANVLRINQMLLMNAAFPETLEMVRNTGYTVQPVDISEFLKAEAGLTCLNLLFSKYPSVNSSV
jgi:dimethylargininase